MLASVDWIRGQTMRLSSADAIGVVMVAAKSMTAIDMMTRSDDGALAG